MKLGVVGGRDFNDTKRMDEVLSEWKPDVVVSGGAKGADIMSEKWAVRNGIPIEIYLPDFKAHSTSWKAYHARNRQIVNNSDELLAFWDGKSTGTKNSIDYAVSQGKKVTIERY